MLKLKKFRCQKVKVLPRCIIHILYTGGAKIKKKIRCQKVKLLPRCIIHILYTGGAKIKKKSGAKRLEFYHDVLFTFYIQRVLKLKKNPVPKG